MAIDLRNVPVFQISKNIYSRTDISRVAKAIYIALCFWSSEGVKPDIEAMSVLSGYTSRTFYRGLRELRENKIIEQHYGKIRILE